MTDGEHNEPETLLEAEDVAGLLKVHKQTVYDLARSGRLPAVKIGKVWRFRPSDVSAFQRGAA